jgi:hypothetical protein
MRIPSFGRRSRRTCLRALASMIHEARGGMHGAITDACALACLTPTPRPPNARRPRKAADRAVYYRPPHPHTQQVHQHARARTVVVVERARDRDVASSAVQCCHERANCCRHEPGGGRHRVELGAAPTVDERVCLVVLRDQRRRRRGEMIELLLREIRAGCGHRRGLVMDSLRLWLKPVDEPGVCA